MYSKEMHILTIYTVANPLTVSYQINYNLQHLNGPLHALSFAQLKSYRKISDKPKSLTIIDNGFLHTLIKSI